MDWPLDLSPTYAPFISNAEHFWRRVRIQPAYASQAWPLADQAIYTPVFIPDRRDVTHLYAFNGATASGNCDIGLFEAYRLDIDGGLNGAPGNGILPGALLTSAGSTAQAGTSAWQEFNVTDVEVGPGWYFLAYVLDNTTGTVMRLGGFDGLATYPHHAQLTGTLLGVNEFPLSGSPGTYDPAILTTVIPSLALGRVS